MKPSKLLSVAAPALATFGLLTAFNQSPPEDVQQTGSSVERMRADLDATQATVEKLAKDLADTRAELQETQAQLARQAQAATQMTGTLDAAEKAGFAMGVNYESRKILLKGWRQYLAASGSTAPIVERDISASRHLQKKRR